MGFICAIAECKNTKKIKKERGNTLVFHRFPIKNTRICKVWITKCHREKEFKCTNATICSDPFTSDDYEPDLMNKMLGLPERKRLKPDAIPSVFPQRVSLMGSMEQEMKSKGRSARAFRRSDKQLVTSIVEVPVDKQAAEVADPPPSPTSSDHAFNQLSEARCLLHQSQNFNIQQRRKILQLKAKNRLLEIRLKRAKCRKNNQSFKNKLHSVHTIFSPSQLKKLSGQKNVRWSREDIVKALTLRSVSLKAYKTSIETWKLPLPAVRTLQSWVHTFTCKPGLLEDILLVMGEHSKSLDVNKRLCVITFDEMSINSQFVQDPTFDKVESHSKVQVIMARGLIDNWKQPIYFNYDTDIDKSILFEVINKLESTGYPVVAMASDLMSTNRGLWKEIGVSERCTSFANPNDSNRNVFVFGDIPHCLKNLRNHLLDQPLLFPDGTVLTLSMLETLVKESGTELKLCPKLTPYHLQVVGAERMRVRPAAQLLSAHTAALANIVYPNLPTVSKFFETVNNGFDVLNSRVPVDTKNKLKCGYGLNLEEQNKALHEFLTLIQDIRFMKTSQNSKICVSPSLLPFQIGFVISIISLINLSAELKKLYNLNYMLTSRLNQDVLENLFSLIRCFGGNPNTNPTSAEFRFRLRLIILGSKFKPPSRTNVEFMPENFSYLSANLLKQNKMTLEQTGTNIDEPELDNLPGVEVLPNTFAYKESLRYLAGYIAWKLKRKGKTIYGVPTSHNELNHGSAGWIELLSRGGLLVPNEKITDDIEICEKEFLACFDKVAQLGNITKRIEKRIVAVKPGIDLDVVKEFLKTRIKIRVRTLNMGRRQLNINKKKNKHFIQSSKSQ